MSINIEELKRLHREAAPSNWTDLFVNEPGYDIEIWLDGSHEKAVMRYTDNEEQLVCFLRNNCKEIIEALEFSKNRDEAKV